MKSLGGNATVRNAYPGWEFQKHSPLREIVAESYNLPIEAITVLVEAFEREDIGVAGELLSDRE